MHAEIALLGLAVFLWTGLLKDALGHVPISGPILFAAIGTLAGPVAFGLVEVDGQGAGLLLLAQYALAVVLFVDAANTRLSYLRGTGGVPQRLLLIGLPLSLAGGAGVARLVFPELDWLQAFLLAALVTPTDAALGLPVIENRAVPEPLREGLKFESGLNDGAIAPVVLVLLALATGASGSGSGLFTLPFREIGVGVLVGGGLGLAAARIMRAAGNRVGDHRESRALGISMLAAAAFGLTHALGGAGFIGAFVGGLTFGLGHGSGEGDRRRAGTLGEGLSLAAWLVFGVALIEPLGHAITVEGVLFAVLSIGVVRTVSVMGAFAGSGFGLRDRLFLGWFGPRGLASVVFILLVANAPGGGEPTVLAAATCTVALSVIVHGITAGFAGQIFPGNRG